jgi:hypothetical protein
MLLRIGESKWHTRRPETVAIPLMPDHGHLMHLFLIRTPQMDRFYHLHPVPDKGGVFLDDLPPMAAGHYQVFADVVRVSGFPDTMTAEIDIPEIKGKPLAGDDSEATAPPISSGSFSSNPGNRATGSSGLISPFSDGARMMWERAPGPLLSNQLLWFKFRVEDAEGKPVKSLEPYMGMAGHAEFVRSDSSVFAHVHPDGSVPMAAVQLADKTLPATLDSQQNNDAAKAPEMNMSGMAMGLVPPEVAFPYGFPKPGVYRIFVQVKLNGRIETGVFDAEVK